ncbi:uncharacterized protein AKAME5_001437000 [Lates japonicus]|uniref:Uncharacterized protein n=1 Tax=Lates japonicus TaxID=270547 RepID=A0AAD3MYT6_LATJO|nr:uncharacterized protein AKAME5_001437000 [Lates japonicus]
MELKAERKDKQKHEEKKEGKPADKDKKETSKQEESLSDALTDPKPEEVEMSGQPRLGLEESSALFGPEETKEVEDVTSLGVHWLPLEPHPYHRLTLVATMGLSALLLRAALQTTWARNPNHPGQGRVGYLSQQQLRWGIPATFLTLESQGMKILPYLDNWLISAPSRAQVARDRAVLLSHTARLGLTLNFKKSSLTPLRAQPSLV